MGDFETLRQRMVKTQLMPEGVLNENILKAFAKIPREYFVPEEMAGISYQDESFKLTEDRFLMRPALLGRLFEAASFQKTDRVLYIGALTGYGPAVLSSLVHEIVAVENDPFLFVEIEQNLSRLKISNVTPLKGGFEGDYSAAGHYNAIFIEGAVERISKLLCKQLAPKGYLLTVMHDLEKGDHALQIFQEKEGIYSQTLFSAQTPLLKYFMSKNEFSF